ncbi:amidohydrolase [Candidatus Bathyarchaeota archaeon]|nr:amidohydrolase [Candidatus Bathyarchaeota archaeon]
MSGLSREKQAAFEWIDENEKRISDFHQLIWNYAEPAWREYKSAEAYCKLLSDEGFRVVEGTGEMPTAFMATYGSGRPVIAGYAEYDAVPGFSQKPAPYRAPRDGFNPWAAGHTDPHSALGVASLAGVLAAKHVMEKFGLNGTLKFFGEPAEKVCGSKPVHAAKGYYDDLDAAICYHPGGYNTCLWETQSGAYWSAVFTFECLEPEKWFKPVAPIRMGGHAGGRCPAALDAVCLMYTTTKYTKEAMLPHTSYWTLNEFIMVGGQCTSDNVPPSIGQIQYAWRVPTLEMAQRIYEVLENNAKHVAEITFCKLTVRWVTKTRVALPNNTMAEITYRNLELVGPPRYGEEAKRVGREIQRNLGLEPMEDPFTEECQRLTPPQEYEAIQRRTLEPWQRHMGADDYVEYTWHAPSVRLYTAKAILRPPSPGYMYPSWAVNALGGIRSTIDPSIMVAGKTMAATYIDLLTKPELLAKAKEEFNERTGGGIGGIRWVAPLLPRDFKPPVDLRWPEYITTPRGEEWWIPTRS